jgi:hypothetical protein
MRSTLSYLVQWLVRTACPITSALLMVSCLADGSEGQPITQNMRAKNLLPGIGNRLERLGFHTGRSVGNRPEISSTRPRMPGPQSAWTLVQWSQPEIISPTSLRLEPTDTIDKRLGLALYAFDTPDGHSHLWIYREKHTHRLVYELYERGGSLTASGGQNLFLSRDAMSPGIRLDHEINYDFYAKISRATIEAEPLPQKTGAVAAQVFTGFVVQFPENNTEGFSTLFLQLPISQSMSSGVEYRSCASHAQLHTLIVDPLLPNSSELPFRGSSGPLKPIHVTLNGYLCELLLVPFTCTDETGATTTWNVPHDLTTFHEWRITSLYVGLETQTQDLRPNATLTGIQGQTDVALQLANIRVSASKRPFTPSNCLATQTNRADGY